MVFGLHYLLIQAAMRIFILIIHDTLMSPSKVFCIANYIPNLAPNGLRYPPVGGTRQRHFDGTSFEPSVNPFWRRIPTSRVHALLARF